MTTKAESARMPGPGEITRLLEQMREGDPEAAEELAIRGSSDALQRGNTLSIGRGGIERPACLVRSRGSFVESHLLEQLFEARMVSQREERWLHQVDNKPAVTFLAGLLQQVQRFVRLTQPQMDLRRHDR